VKVLLVEDDADLAAGLVKALQAEGIIVAHAATGDDARKQLRAFEPDVAVLDLGLPDMDGLQVLDHICRGKQPVATLVLTARSDLRDKVFALDHGADDYLVKPFEMAELLARIRAMSRRKGTARNSSIEIGEVILDTTARTLTVRGEEVPLPKKEYMALKLLMEDAGRVKTREMLEDNLYEWGEGVGSNAVEVHISNLRKKLPEHFIKTIRGVGYTVDARPA